MKAMYTRRNITLVSVRGTLLVALMLSGSEAFAQTTTITNLVVPGAAYVSVAGLNDAGQVAGYYYTADWGQRAFLWSSGIGTDLGTLGGSVAVANGLNNLGQVIGFSSSVGDTEYHAFSGIGLTLFDLGTLGGAVSSATAISDAGYVTGYSYVSLVNLDYHGFLLRNNGVMRDLGTLGGSTSAGKDVNSAGQVTGDSAMPGDATVHAFLYGNGAMRDLGTLGGTYSTAFALNELGQVTGEATTSGDLEAHAFFFNGTSMLDLGTLGGTFSSAFALNDLGHVIGDSSLAGDTEYHGFIFRDGAMQDLGTLGGHFSGAWAINGLGQVVGVSSNANFQMRAFLWQNGTMTDLNTLLPAHSGWELTGAFFINDNGQIVGNGLYQGQPSWFLLSVRAHENQTPVANAGPDQTAECSGGSALVVLDGSASSDPDGDALSFTWLEGDAALGTGARTTVSLALGSHTLTLRVTDSNGASAEDTAVVTVRDSLSPTLQCPGARSAAANAQGQVLLPDFRADVLAADNCTATRDLVKEQSPAPGTTVGCGTHEITVTVTDAAGNRAVCTTTFTVVDVTPPVVSCPEPISRSVGTDCQAAVPDVSALIAASDNCTPASALVIRQEPAAGTLLGLGQVEVHVSVTDAAGNATRCTVVLNVVDRTAPTISSLTADTLSLAPANHHLVPVTLTAVASDNCDANPVCQIVSVTSSEPVTGPGDNTSPDWNITGNLTLELRAEVTSQDLPRVYTILVSCTDASGNTSYRSLDVTVPKNKKTTTTDPTPATNSVPGKKK